MRWRTSGAMTDDMTISGGWLFADLLLGLLIVFLVAVPIIPKYVPPVIPPPTLNVNPTQLAPGDGHCSKDPHQPRCTITLTETGDSQGTVNWNASSDMSNSINFSPASGTLSPGQSIDITIAAFPCQNGAFFLAGTAGTRQAGPLMVQWHCTLPVEKLNLNRTHLSLTLTNDDVSGLLGGQKAAINDVKQQLMSNPQLVNKSVGFAIVYGGAPSTQNIPDAIMIANGVYAAMKQLHDENIIFGRAAFYDPLHVLNNDPTDVEIDVYFFE